MPEASDRVARVPAVLLFSVTKLPAVPDTENAETVVVVLAGNVIVDGTDVAVMLMKVLAPVIVSAPAPP